MIVRKSFAMSSTSYRISESQIEVPNFLIKKQNRSKTKAKAYFFFWSLRGRGKSSAMISLVKQEHFPILFFFRNLKMRLRHASCKIFGKRVQKIELALAEARFLRGQNRIKKGVVSQSGDCKMTTFMRRFRFLKRKRHPSGRASPRSGPP